VDTIKIESNWGEILEGSQEELKDISIKERTDSS